MLEPSAYEGGCHCGAVRFRVRVARHEAVDCNCSICRKKGFLHLIVPPEDFTLLAGSEALTTYTFNTGIAKHLFCRVCGIHAFYHPRSHPNDFDVNLRCLDEDVLAKFQITPFDGSKWEENIDQLHSDSSVGSELDPNPKSNPRSNSGSNPSISSHSPPL